MIRPSKIMLWVREIADGEEEHDLGAVFQVLGNMGLDFRCSQWQAHQDLHSRLMEGSSMFGNRNPCVVRQPPVAQKPTGNPPFSELIQEVSQRSKAISTSLYRYVQNCHYVHPIPSQ